MKTKNKAIKLISSFFAIIIFAFSFCFVGCKEEEIKQLNFEETSKALNNYSYYSSQFISSIKTKNASNTNINVIKKISGEKIVEDVNGESREVSYPDWNTVFTSIVSEVYNFKSQIELIGNVNDYYTFSETSVKFVNNETTVEVATNADYSKMKTYYKTTTTEAFLEYVCTGIGIYYGQLIIKSGTTFDNYQFSFSGADGTISVLLNKAEYSSIFDAESIPSTFAAENGSTYFFN